MDEFMSFWDNKIYFICAESMDPADEDLNISTDSNVSEIMFLYTLLLFHKYCC